MKKVAGKSSKTIFQNQHFTSIHTCKVVIWHNHTDEIAQKLYHPFNSIAMKQWEVIIIGDYKNVSVAIRKLLKIN